MTPWTVTPQASLSLGFSRQESFSELPVPSPGDFSNLGMKPGSPLQADSLLSEPPLLCLYAIYWVCTVVLDEKNLF